MDFGQSFPYTGVRRAGLYGLIDDVNPNEIRRYYLDAARRNAGLSFGIPYDSTAQRRQQEGFDESSNLSEDVGPTLPESVGLASPSNVFYNLFSPSIRPTMLRYFGQYNPGFLDTLRARVEQRRQQEYFNNLFSPSVRPTMLRYFGQYNPGFLDALRARAEQNRQREPLNNLFSPSINPTMLRYFGQYNPGFLDTLRARTPYGVGLYLPR